MALTNPIERGVITDWDAMEKVWEYALQNELRVDPETMNFTAETGRTPSPASMGMIRSMVAVATTSSTVDQETTPCSVAMTTTECSVGGATINSAAKTAISYIDTAISTISDNRSALGATINRFEAAASGIRGSRTAADASLSTIRDADIAREVTEFARNQVLVEASNAMLVQVNVTSIGVLSLL